ncbi:MAG: glycoside hydrolase family 5 protein [Lactobacillaceae bacterium]|jgi:hypothetical protein|nr:glycoside hydrolase family 5 protein [Lactobacillaceae bacterium]
MKKVLITLIVICLSLGSLVSMTHSIEVEENTEQTAALPTPVPLNKQTPFSKGYNFYLNGSDVRKDLNPKDLRTNIGKIKFIHDIGGDVVRIPIPLISTMNNPTHQVDPQIMSSLHALIDEVSKPEYQPMHIIIDNHDGGNNFTKIQESENPLTPTEVMITLWQQMAEEFKDAPDNVVFELKNEPDWDDTFNQQEWADIQARVVNEVREIDIVHSIIISEWAKASMNPTRNPFYTRAGLHNKNVILNVHFYCPVLFSFQGFPTNNYNRVGDIQWPFDAADFPLPESYRYLEYIDSPSLDLDTSVPAEHYRFTSQPTYMADVINEYTIKANILDAPLFVGEWGTGGKQGIQAARLQYYNFIAEQFGQRGISWTSWNLDDYQWAPMDITKHTTDFLYENDVFPDVLQAMGLHAKSLPHIGTDNFVMYDEDVHWCKNFGLWWGEYSATPYSTRFDTDGNHSLLDIKYTGSNRDVRFQFMDGIDATQFVADGYTLEFDAKADGDVPVWVGFANSGSGRLNKRVDLVGNHQYHHYSVPLNNLGASGGIDTNHYDVLSMVGGTPEAGNIEYDNVVLQAPHQS